jgi:hypothetical protein
MKTFDRRTSESLFDLETQNVVESPIDMVELTDDDLEEVSGSCWGCMFDSFGGFLPWFGGFGGFGSAFALSGFGGYGGWGW